MSRSHSRFSLEYWLPEQRLFLRSDTGTRFLRLRPATQFVALGGAALLLGWTIIATAVLAIDSISAGSSREQVMRAQAAFEQRLTDLAAERDARAAEAVAAQERFATALAQVSQMQSQLLTSEQRRQELETGLGTVQTTLHTAISDRDEARDEAARLTAALGDGATPEAARTQEFSVALDILSDELKQAATARSAAETDAAVARDEARQIAVERDAIVARNDEILARIEGAVAVSTEPMDRMFRSVGVNPDELLRTVRRGYSGTGGPLTTAGVSTHGNAEISEAEARATKVMISLDQMQSYSIAMDKVPLAMPVRSAHRFTSPFGRRWGRMHEGIDLAGPHGTPIHSTAEGVITFAGWQRGYGNVIRVQHALGIETRYAHLSKIHVTQGQRVSRGTRIGDMGNTGRSTGTHLHYEVRVNGTAVDPMKFIRAAQNVF